MVRKIIHLAAAAIVLWITAVCLFAPPLSQAQDRWLGPDKALHFGAGAVIAASVTTASGSEPAGVAAAAAAGVLKELSDHRRGGPFSLKDALVTGLGGLAGARIGGYLVSLQPRGVLVSVPLQ